MKIFRSDQIRLIDEYTIKNEPVAAIDLMERAANALAAKVIETFDKSSKIIVFAGPGNNGGDGLALARLLSVKMYDVEVYFVTTSSNTSQSCEINRQRLEDETIIPLKFISNIDQFPTVPKRTIIIDAIFGSGISRPVSGLASDVIRKINTLEAIIISIDTPSGLFGEDNGTNDPESIIRADYTFTFQFPRLAFMFSENERYTGNWILLDIGLNKEIIDRTETTYNLIEGQKVSPLIKSREKFSHKGTFGHGLMIGGSYGKMGAMILGAGAALHTGIGLVTCHIPSIGDHVLQSSLPESMVIHDQSEKVITEIGDLKPFSAVGIGPGMGTATETQRAFEKFLRNNTKPLVIDADALNILSLNKKWLTRIPEKAILTPHPGEFTRLAGKSANGYERLKKQLKFSDKYNCIVILKGAYTSISLPGGEIWFNSTGNPGMATAGSGDVLTGMILSLLAQGYSPENAAIAGVYIHGLAGDIASDKCGPESMIASDIINNIGAAFKKIRNIKR
jgi:hydroxyethylthiazole kinase-like uncharacterized protein yjeF